MIMKRKIVTIIGKQKKKSMNNSIINYDIESLKKVVLKLINVNNVNTKCIIYNKKLEENINIFFNNILIESIGTSILIKSIINFFRSNNSMFFLSSKKSSTKT